MQTMNKSIVSVSVEKSVSHKASQNFLTPPLCSLPSPASLSFLAFCLPFILLIIFFLSPLLWCYGERPERGTKNLPLCFRLRAVWCARACFSSLICV